METSLVNYYLYSEHIGYPGVSYKFSEEEYHWSPAIRVGLLDNVEFYVNPSYTSESENVKGSYSAPYVPVTFDNTTHRSSFGAVNLEPKVNLWGNNGGMTSFALSPYLGVPTGHGAVRGGGAAAFGVSLPYAFYLKVESELYDTRDHRTVYGGFYNAISLHKKLCSKSDAFAYLDSAASSDPDSSWYGYTGFGATYSITRNLQLFGAMGFGIVSAAFDYNPRFGVVARF